MEILHRSKNCTKNCNYLGLILIVNMNVLLLSLRYCLKQDNAKFDFSSVFLFSRWAYEKNAISASFNKWNLHFATTIKVTRKILKKRTHYLLCLLNSYFESVAKIYRKRKFQKEPCTGVPSSKLPWKTCKKFIGKHFSLIFFLDKVVDSNNNFLQNTSW